MPWSRLRGQPPDLKRWPGDGQPPRPAPLLTQPFAGGMTAWVVIFCAVIAELAGGAAVVNQASAAIAVPVLIVPVAWLVWPTVSSYRPARAGRRPPGTVAPDVARAAPP